MRPSVFIRGSAHKTGHDCRECGAWTERGIPHTCPGTAETSANDQTMAILGRLDHIIRILDEMRLRR